MELYEIQVDEIPEEYYDEIFNDDDDEWYDDEDEQEDWYQAHGFRDEYDYIQWKYGS